MLGFALEDVARVAKKTSPTDVPALTVENAFKKIKNRWGSLDPVLITAAIDELLQGYQNSRNLQQGLTEARQLVRMAQLTENEAIHRRKMVQCIVELNTNEQGWTQFERLWWAFDLCRMMNQAAAKSKTPVKVKTQLMDELMLFF